MNEQGNSLSHFVIGCYATLKKSILKLCRLARWGLEWACRAE